MGKIVGKEKGNWCNDARHLRYRGHGSLIWIWRRMLV